MINHIPILVPFNILKTLYKGFEGKFLAFAFFHTDIIILYR